MILIRLVFIVFVFHMVYIDLIKGYVSDAIFTHLMVLIRMKAGLGRNQKRLMQKVHDLLSHMTVYR